VTVESPQIAGSTAADETVRNWENLRDSGDIQFAPVQPPKTPEPPEWLRLLDQWLRDLFEPLGRALGASGPTILKILAVLAVILALYVIWRLLQPWLAKWRQQVDDQEEGIWAPDRNSAQALIDEADRLAAAGKFEEAVHLLLQRSVTHIADARPEWLHPASTAREIASIPMLPESARSAFGVIAMRVERSLFALRKLDEADWLASRAAYADFALAEFST